MPASKLTSAIAEKVCGLIPNNEEAAEPRVEPTYKIGVIIPPTPPNASVTAVVIVFMIGA